MLIGAHVSTAGGLVNAHERGVERGCEAIQVFNQSPRMWRPTTWKDDDIAAFQELMDGGPIKSVVIHAVYLINCATKDKEMRKKSIASLTHALQMGDAIGANGVVVHPGSTVGEPHAEAIARAGSAFVEALNGSDSCPLLLEDTAGSGNTLGRDFTELRDLIDAAGADKRIGICLDSCHMLASGFDITTADKLGEVLDESVELIGTDKVKCLHVNDSKVPLGSNVDRHAPPGDGHLGDRGCGAFLSEPRFEGLPALFEGPGVEGKAPALADVDKMKSLRKKGLAARKRRKTR
ncbi:MAG: deoxyribonuclease IV [Thermoleophilaceae bacterium]